MANNHPIWNLTTYLCDVLSSSAKAHELKQQYQMEKALLKDVCSLPKKIPDVNIRNLLLGMRLQCTWSKEITSLQCSGHPIRKVYYASIILGC